MTKEQYNKAADILNRIKVAERNINEANRIINLREDRWMYRMYWDAILDLLWDDEARDTLDNDLFAAIKGFKCKMQTEKEKLEKQFNEL